MVLMSTVSVLSLTIGRRPSISTMLRFAPRPRRSMFAWPLFGGLFEVVVPAGLICGRVFR